MGRGSTRTLGDLIVTASVKPAFAKPKVSHMSEVI